MLTRRVAAAPRAEAPATAFSLRSRAGICCAMVRSRDAQRASAALTTAAFVPSSTAMPSPRLLRRRSSVLASSSRKTTTKHPLAPRATPENDLGSSGSDDDSEGAAEGGESDNADDSTSSTPPPSPETPAASRLTTGVKRTAALEARQADRLRNQLLSMMPDPVDDPLFDAAELASSSEGDPYAPPSAASDAAATSADPRGASRRASLKSGVASSAAADGGESAAAAAAAAAWADVGIGGDDDEEGGGDGGGGERDLFGDEFGRAAVPQPPPPLPPLDSGSYPSSSPPLPPLPPLPSSSSLPSDRVSAAVAELSAGNHMVTEELMRILEAYHLEEDVECLQERAMTLMTEQRSRPVNLYGQTIALATLMEELGEREELRRAGANADEKDDDDDDDGTGGKGERGEGDGEEGGDEDETKRLEALEAAAAEAEAGKLPPLLLAPDAAPGITMTAVRPPPNALVLLDDELGVQMAEIPDWIAATFALEARWGRLEKLEEARRERIRLSEEWAPPAELRDRLLLGDPSLMAGVPDGQPGGSDYGEVDPLMRLMEGVLPGVDDSEFGEEGGGGGGGGGEEEKY